MSAGKELHNMPRMILSWVKSQFKKEAVRVFISHSTLEKALANYLKLWIEREVPGSTAFCAGFPENLPPGRDWLKEIITEASSSDLCLVLLSPDSLDKQWLYFEAGLTLGAKDINLVAPVLYGGLKANEIPAPLKHRQALIIRDQESFEAFVKYPLGADQTVEAHKNFTSLMSPEVTRLVDYGLYGGLFTQALVEKQGDLALKAAPNKEVVKEFDRKSEEGEIVAVRATAVPRPQGSIVHWKFGMHLRDPSRAGLDGRVFELHSGVHEGHHVWTIYDKRSTLHAFNIPAHFENNQTHNLELWFDTDMRHVICVGTDSKHRRVCLQNENGDVRWRLNDNDWDKIVVKAWGDESRCHIDVDSLEIHRNK